MIVIRRSSSTCSEHSADDKLVLVMFPDEAAFHVRADSPESLEISKDRKTGTQSIVLLARLRTGGIAKSGDYHPHRGPNPNPIPKPSGNAVGAK